MVIGAVNDKDVEGMLSKLPSKATYYFCKANIPRGLDATILKKNAAAFGLKGKKYASVKEALDAAKSSAGKDDLIFVGGSTFVVADALQLFDDKN